MTPCSTSQPDEKPGLPAHADRRAADEDRALRQSLLHLERDRAEFVITREEHPHDGARCPVALRADLLHAELADREVLELPDRPVQRDWIGAARETDDRRDVRAIAESETAKREPRHLLDEHPRGPASISVVKAIVTHRKRIIGINTRA
jgi:hypothetical protein